MSSAIELWRTYSREEIPPLFGLTFSTAIWQVGFVPVGKQIVLLVTLEKDGHIEEHRYEDRFLSPDRFEWKSQNRTTQGSKHGQMICHHKEKDIVVHLFIRRAKRINGKSSPFHYCGPVIFDKWQGDKPITIDWQMTTPVPERLHRLFLITESKNP